MALLVAGAWLRAAEPVELTKDSPVVEKKQQLPPLSQRAAFLSRVYRTALPQLLTTAAVAGALVLAVRPSPDAVFGLEGSSRRHRLFGGLTAVPARRLMILAILGVVAALLVYRRDPGRSLHLFEALAVAEGYWVGIASSALGGRPRAVGHHAVALTLLVCVAHNAGAGWLTSAPGSGLGLLRPIFAEVLVLWVWSRISKLLFGLDKGRRFACGVALATGMMIHIAVGTSAIARRYTDDEYVTAAVEVYLDLLNLSMELLKVLAQASAKKII